MSEDDAQAGRGVSLIPVTVDDVGLRLDRWFRRHYPGVTHARLEKWLRQGQVRIDGRRAVSGERLNTGQVVRVPPLGPVEVAPPRVRPAAVPAPGDVAELTSRILHLDDSIIVLDKPAGLAVQGGSKLSRHLDAMIEVLSFGGERPRLVHRLDRDTSGALVLARTAAAARLLTAAFRGKRVRKLYWAIVVGLPSPPMGRISLPLRKGQGRHGERMIADEGAALPAITEYRLIDRVGRRAAWLAMEPLTGRTHQLRVHAASLGTPILGDRKYGGAHAFLAGHEISPQLHLHARALRFDSPMTGSGMTVFAPPPAHFLTTFRFLGFDGNHPDAGPSWDKGTRSSGRPHRRSPRMGRG